MVDYYRGHIGHHATFWVRYRELPFDEQFTEFIKFFKTVENEVKEGKCRLKDAGYALEPGYHDKAIQANPHGGDMTIVCLRAGDLAAGGYEDREEAEGDWEQIVGIMEKYV